MLPKILCHRREAETGNVGVLMQARAEPLLLIWLKGPLLSLYNPFKGAVLTCVGEGGLAGLGCIRTQIRIVLEFINGNVSPCPWVSTSWADGVPRI